MLDQRRLVIVGSGPTALYLLKHIADSPRALSDHIASSDVFEQNMQFGVGMPHIQSAASTSIAVTA